MGDLILPPVIGVIARVDTVGNIEKVLGRADLAPVEVGGDVVGLLKTADVPKTVAGNIKISTSEDEVGLLKDGTFTGRLDRIVRPDTPEAGKDALITGVERDTVGLAREATLSSIDGKTPSLTVAGNVPMSVSEDAVGLLKDGTFTGRLDRLVRPDTPEVGKDALITGVERDAVGIAKEATLASINGKTPSLTAAGNVPIAISEDIVNLLKEAALRAALKDEFALGVKPETDYNSTTLADDAFLTIVPPSGQYVYLMCITANVGTDGDVVELQVLDVDGVTWHTVDRLKMLANTSMMKGYPNLKLDKVKVAGVEKTVKAGDGTTATVRLSVLDADTGILTAVGADSINSIDVTDKTAPSLIHSLTTAQLDGARENFIKDTYAYVAAYAVDTLTVIDCSNPAALTQVGYVSATELDGASGVYVADSYAYVSALAGDRFSIVDIIDPTAPSLVSSITATELDGAMGVRVDGNYAYVTGALADSFVIIDITDKAAPTIVASITAVELDGANFLDWSSPYAYVPASAADRLTIVDASDPTAPGIMGSVTDVNLDLTYFARVHEDSCFNTAYGADRFNTIDVTDKTAPTLIASIASVELDGAFGECLVLA